MKSFRLQAPLNVKRQTHYSFSGFDGSRGEASMIKVLLQLGCDKASCLNYFL